MGGLTNIVGGATIAVSTAVGGGSLQAQEDPREIFSQDLGDGIPVQSQLVQRIEENPLPALDPNIFNPDSGTRLRAPVYQQGHPTPYDSIGPVDSRLMPDHANRVYDPVVQMVDENGFNFCTATISNIHGFELTEPGTLFTTAAHCMEIRNPMTGETLGYRDPSNVSFHGSYLDENGNIDTFEIQGEQSWINPLYDQHRPAELAAGRGYDNDAESDTALIFSREVTPDGVTPARVLPVDHEDIANLRDGFFDASREGAQVHATVAGHSGDKAYLTSHEGANIVYGDSDGFITDADIAPGDSGGPVFLSDPENGNPVVTTEAGEPVILGVNSTIEDRNRFEQIERPDGTMVDAAEQARHSYIVEDTLSTVPFLRPDGTPSDEICFQQGTITASELNIRVGPDVSEVPLAPLPGQDTSRLPQGSTVTVHDTTRNELGQQWALVSGPDGRTGYVSNNPEYIDVGPRVCTPAPMTP